MLEACDGYVYTLAELDELIEPEGPLHRFIGSAG